jgi:hypothetical protein
MPTPASASPRVAVTGASGLIGSVLTATLEAAGQRVDRLVRRPPAPGAREIRWDPEAGVVDAAALEGVDAVVHLAGESLAVGRWTPARKAAVRRSRVEGTACLARTLAGLRRPPRVLVAASAIGYYGDRGEEPVTEDSAPGTGFLPEVCRAWEAAAQPARAAGIRLVHARMGVVLAREGGALARMLPPFRLGLGGVIGSGRQYVSWIALADVVAALRRLLADEALAGPVNVTAPAPVTNAEFTRTLARVLGRPALVPLPALAVRLLFGEMGQALLLEGARVLPARLEAAGFRVAHPALEGALRAVLARAG